MSTNYNDGLWHGWNGGECPVHPKTEVEVVWLYRDNSLYKQPPSAAGNVAFLGNEHGAIIAFRVLKEFRGPSEWWIVGGCEAWDDEELARGSARRLPDATVIHVREVLE